MKLKHALSMVLLAFASVFRFGAREEVYNIASTTGGHANGIVPLNAEEAITTRYLLVKKGTAANGVLINAAATTRPWGVAMDEPASGDSCAVALLAAVAGTVKMVAAAAITPGNKVYTAANGKVTGTYAAGAFCVGQAVNAAAADGDIVEVAPIMPILDASGTAL